MIRDFVHLIQNKLRHYAVFPSLHSLSRSSAFQTALFLLGVLAFARACIFLAPPSVTTLASASVNGTFMPICRVETDQKKVALTFNCTYSAQDMQQLLEILKEKNVHATFFLVGNYLQTSPDLVKRMVAEGHNVGNHTFHHPDMSKISTKEAFEKELNDLETLYQQTTGQPMKKYYRPPQGKYSESNLKMANDMGYKTFFWSLAYVDWYEDKQPTKEEAFKKLLTRIHPGAIVLLHSTSKTNGQILDELLTKWEEMGYHFGTLDDLVAADQT